MQIQKEAHNVVDEFEDARRGVALDFPAMQGK